MLGGADLVLVMSKGHQEALKVEFPEIADRVFLVSEMAGYSFDVRDPIGGSLADFRDTARELDTLLEQGLARIERQGTGAMQFPVVHSVKPTGAYQ